MIICDSKEKINELKNKVLQLRFKDSQKIIELCTAIESYAYKNDDRELLGFSYLYKGEAYYILNDIESMFQNCARAITFLSVTNQWENLARAYNMMAITSINKGNMSLAADYYIRALNCTDNHPLSPARCSIYINLGYLYMQNGLYNEAKEHLLTAYDIYNKTHSKEAEINRIIMIYTNLATCYMLCNDLDIAGLYIKKLDDECSSHYSDMDYVYVGCLKARYFNACGDEQSRDSTIENVLARIHKQLPLLDLFDDLYSLCELAFEIKQYQVLTQIIDILDPIIESMHMTYLERKLLTLKIKYYKIMHYINEYTHATSRFFELVSTQEIEDKRMVANMLYVRRSLAQTQKSKEEIEAANAVLMKKSETDPLTGLANRYRLTESSQQMIDDCINANLPLTVEILDIDYFKEYNDNYGHQAGDNCIKAVADLIGEMQDDNTFCARYGGDEFIIIYKGLDEQAVLEKAHRIKQNIISLALEHEYSKAFPYVTISQGLCTSIPVCGHKIWDFLHIADEYLYNVKKNNRNGICIGNIHSESRII